MELLTIGAKALIHPLSTRPVNISSCVCCAPTMFAYGGIIFEPSRNLMLKDSGAQVLIKIFTDAVDPLLPGTPIQHSEFLIRLTGHLTV
jgi:hypothetical protein